MRAGPVVVLLFVAACAGKSNSDRQSGAGGAPGSGGMQTTGGSGGKGGKGGTTGGADTTGSGATGGGGGDAMSTGGSGGDAMSTGGSDTGGTGASDTGGTGGSDTGGTGAGDTGGTGGTGAIGEGGMTSATGGTGGSSVPPITSCTDEFPFLGTWEGNVLDFYYEPMDELTLVVEDSNGVVGGTLTYGEGDPPPPPESADIPYPPGFWEDQFEDVTFREPWPGYPYTVVRGAGCDSSFRFSISAAEVFGPWCALQEPVYTAGSGWGCTLLGGGSYGAETCTITAGGQSATYPTWKCMACGAAGRGVCACDEAGCFADLEPTHTFDLTIAATTSGTVLSGPDSSCGDCTVRLELVE